MPRVGEKIITLKKEEIKTDLEEIINRLEETRNNALDMRESNDMGLQSRDYEGEYEERCEEDVERMEAAIFAFGNFIDGIIQLMGEEIENLRSLVEKVDRTD